MLPQRMCAVCRERKEKSQLIRITKTQDGEVLIDKTGKLQGRGMYIPPRPLPGSALRPAWLRFLKRVTPPASGAWTLSEVIKRKTTAASVRWAG